MHRVQVHGHTTFQSGNLAPTLRNIALGHVLKKEAGEWTPVDKNTPYQDKQALQDAVDAGTLTKTTGQDPTIYRQQYSG